MKVYELDCDHCGESFPSVRQWAKFCTGRCKQADYNAKKKQERELLKARVQLASHHKDSALTAAWR